MSNYQFAIHSERMGRGDFSRPLDKEK